MPDLVPVRTALLSVSDKTGLVEFARALAGHGVRLVSTGGTAKALIAAGLEVTPIESLTGFPEMMDGRLKTLHPKVHGGLLGLRDHHGAAMREHAIDAIDLVCINLYPFEATIARPGVTEHEAIENIDIGGPAMIRSASKNFEWVAPVTSPGQYARVVEAMGAGKGSLPRRLRAELAREAFEATAAYDATIAAHFGRAVAPRTGEIGSDGVADGNGDGGRGVFPERLTLPLSRVSVLSYGENPHQRGAAYVDPSLPGIASVLRATKHHGKDLSYNNLNDAAAAWALAEALGGGSGSLGSRASGVRACGTPATPGRLADTVGAVVVKHTNPCGAATAPTVARAVEAAMIGDPLAAYGGILAVSGEIDADSAEWLASRDVFLEVILARAFAAAALERLTARWKNVRLLSLGDAWADQHNAARSLLSIRPIPGGAIVQTPDTLSDPATWAHAAGPAPTDAVRRACVTLECIGRALSSNAIAIGGPDAARPGVVRLFGAGAGQMDRVAACRIAVEKAGDLARGSIAFSDAFFPFPDGPRLLIEAGVATIVHPGGSKRDAETFALCDERGVTCLTTGVRHFRH
ncbi:MAG: bifunctional phosphoribosylaminoimidazolecarboxamide formyltransferase/IMP cyclohydrolase [Phycisphaerales bacterium]